MLIITRSIAIHRYQSPALLGATGAELLGFALGYESKQDGPF